MAERCNIPWTFFFDGEAAFPQHLVGLPDVVELLAIRLRLCKPYSEVQLQSSLSKASQNMCGIAHTFFRANESWTKDLEHGSVGIIT